MVSVLFHYHHSRRSRSSHFHLYKNQKIMYLGQKELQCIRVLYLTLCPPNIYLIPFKTLDAKAPRRRELNLSYKALLITGAGIPRSTAAWTVQRPSPESLTPPSNLSRW